MKSYLMEAIGTLFLILVIALTGNPVAIAATLAAMIYIGAHVSGGHYNPAVSIAVSIVGKQAWSKTIGYIFAQLSGGLLGVLVAHILSGKILVVAPAPETLLYQGILAEGLFTFVLVSAVLHTAVSHKAAGNSYFGMTIGLAVLIGAYSVGTLSGGAFNPAVGIAPLMYSLVTSKVFVLEHLIMYIVGPLMGAVLAAQFYQLTHAHEKHE